MDGRLRMDMTMEFEMEERRPGEESLRRNTKEP